MTNKQIIRAAAERLDPATLHQISAAHHTPEEIAKVIKPQFKETDEATLETIISRYYSQDTWKTDLILQQDSFTLLEDILIDADRKSTRLNSSHRT